MKLCLESISVLFSSVFVVAIFFLRFLRQYELRSWRKKYYRSYIQSTQDFDSLLPKSKVTGIAPQGTIIKYEECTQLLLKGGIEICRQMCSV